MVTANPMLLALLLAVAPAHAGCPAAPSQLRADLDAAYASYVTDDQAWDAHVAEVEGDLGCLTGRVDSATAAQLHLVRALSAFLARDAAQMQRAFAGVLAAEPGFVLSTEVAPAGNDVRKAFEAARSAGPGGSQRVQSGVGVTLTVDGRPAAELPIERAALAQVTGASGSVQSWYLTGASLPDALVQAVEGPARSASTVKKEGHPSRTLLVSGLAVGLASGASLAVAAMDKGAFVASGSQGDADAIYNRNRAFGFTGYGLGIAAVGLGATAVIVGNW